MCRQVTSLTSNTVDLAIKTSYALSTGVKVALVVPLSLTYSCFWTRYCYTTFYFVLISGFLFFFFFILHIWLGSLIGPKNFLFLVTNSIAKEIIIHPIVGLQGSQTDRVHS